MLDLGPSLQSARYFLVARPLRGVLELHFPRILALLYTTFWSSETEAEKVFGARVVGMCYMYMCV